MWPPNAGTFCIIARPVTVILGEPSWSKPVQTTERISTVVTIPYSVRRFAPTTVALVRNLATTEQEPRS